MLAAERAARVFGVAYVGLGARVEPDLDHDRRCRAGPDPSRTVRVLRRCVLDEPIRTSPHRSQEVNEVIGQKIKDATGARVDLKNARGDRHGSRCSAARGSSMRQRMAGAGGLPVGVSGRMLALMSGGIDSPVAAWRIARRGAEVESVHFHGQPFTDPSSVRQAEELAEVIARYQLQVVLHLIPLADAQREIVTHAPSSMRVVLYRRTMMRIAAELARNVGPRLSSPAIHSARSRRRRSRTSARSMQPSTGVQVFRPLIGMDKQEIMDEADADRHLRDLDAAVSGLLRVVRTSLPRYEERSTSRLEGRSRTRYGCARRKGTRRTGNARDRASRSLTSARGGSSAPSRSLIRRRAARRLSPRRNASRGNAPGM